MGVPAPPNNREVLAIAIPTLVNEIKVIALIPGKVIMFGAIVIPAGTTTGKTPPSIVSVPTPILGTIIASIADRFF